MRWPYTKCQTFFLIFYIFFIPYFIVNQWDQYDSCAAPTQIFLLGTSITIFLLVNAVNLLGASDLPNWARKFLMRLLHFVLTPSCIYLSIQGTVWQIMNMVETPKCSAVSESSNFIWGWIMFLTVSGFMFGRITYLTLKHWWRMRQFRNQMRRLNMLESGGDINALLLENGDINDRVGLLPTEIEKLETKNFSRSLMDAITGSETCPICFEDYKAGDTNISLPKCQHAFHSECVKKWLSKTPLCPMCRGNVRTALHEHVPQNQDLENPAN